MLQICFKSSLLWTQLHNSAELKQIIKSAKNVAVIQSSLFHAYPALRVMEAEPIPAVSRQVNSLSVDSSFINPCGLHYGC